MFTRSSAALLSLLASAVLPLTALASGPEVDPVTIKRSAPPPKLAASPHPGAVPSPASAGQRAVVDPRTGRLVKIPFPSGVLSPSMREALSDSSEGLVEVPWRRGGVKVDLKGRYQSAFVATVDENGVVYTECISHVPDEASHAK